MTAAVCKRWLQAARVRDLSWRRVRTFYFEDFYNEAMTVHNFYLFKSN